MNKLVLLCTVCALTIAPTWLEAKVYKEPVATPAPIPVQNSASQAKDDEEDQWNELPVQSGVVPGVPVPYAYTPAPDQQAAQPTQALVVSKIEAKLDAIRKQGYLEDLTLNDLQNKPALFKEAWEGLLDILKDMKNDMSTYDHLSVDGKTAKRMEKARKRVLDIQNEVVDLLKKVENTIEDKKIGWYLREKLLNFYEHLTSEWVNNPYGIDAGYKDIIYGKPGNPSEPGLVNMLKADQPKSIPRPTVMYRGAPMVMTPSNQ